MKIVVIYPSDLTEEEKKSLDGEVQAMVSYYAQRVAEFRAARSVLKTV
jgi:hypothetical protein